MVKASDNILRFFEDDRLLNKEIDKVNSAIAKYPFFQQAWALKTRFFKLKKTYTTTALQQTAIRTIDRRVLFDYLEAPERYQPLRQQKPVQIQKPEAKAETTLVSDKSDMSKSEVSVKASSDKKQSKAPEISKPEEKLNYFEWIQRLKQTEKPKNKPKIDLIDQFLKTRPKIVPKRNVEVKPPDIIEKSVVEKQMLMTETLARLYLKQKKYDKAIQAFRILSLKYPKKSSYFANQIKEIKQNLK